MPLNETEVLIAARNHYVSESLRLSKLSDELTLRLNDASGGGKDDDIPTRSRSGEWTPERRRRQSLAQKKRWRKLKRSDK
jgi:hypothetical protein